jgi:hypothetical protein
MALHDEGGYASDVGRPLGQIFVPPAYGITFFNKTIDAPLEEIEITSEIPALFEYEEDLGDPNLQYSRVLHFNISDSSTGKLLQDDTYVPYINITEVSGDKSKFKIKPLVEVMNPRIVELSPNMFVMYFFSNFTSDELPEENSYTDDPQYLRRMVEFATNDPDELNNKIPPDIEEAPYPNDRNYYVDDTPRDKTPRTAFMSCLLRVFSVKTGDPAVSKTFVVAEKPLIITWIGHRFALDTHPPLLVNKVQSIEWTTDKEDTDNYLNEQAANSEPPRQIPYHHLISRINTVMHNGYAGINFYTKPITDFYDLALDHVFRKNGVASKNFDFYANGRKLKSIQTIQEDAEQMTGSSTTDVVSDYSPFQRHFSILEIDGDLPSVLPSSSSSSSSEPSYTIEIPGSIDVRGDDKPEFWSSYWDVCDEDAPAGVGGDIIVSYEGDSSWYGEECIDGITMYAKLERRPYGYYENERLKFWLTIGPKTDSGVELDVVWQGFKVEDTSPIGFYTRYYSLGDGTPSSIEVTA